MYTQALVLLKDVKEGILGLLVPQQKRTIDSINERLDLDLVKQQAENGVLDFQVRRYFFHYFLEKKITNYSVFRATPRTS